MSIRRIIGGSLLASPFAAAFVVFTAEHGILFSLTVFGVAAVVFAVIGVGVWLID